MRHLFRTTVRTVLITTSIVIGTLMASGQAQSQSGPSAAPTELTFDVASVKPIAPRKPSAAYKPLTKTALKSDFIEMRGRPTMTTSPAGIVYTNVSLSECLESAY